MSHHLDSPLARKDVRLDITDVYLFKGERGTVFIINVNSSISGPTAPSGFHPEALYEFKIDTNGDAIEDITYRLAFGERGPDGEQTLELCRLDGTHARDHVASAPPLVKGLTNTILSTEDGTRVWAGLAGEPFYIEPTVVGAMVGAMSKGTAIDLTAWDRNAPKNLFADTNVNAIVLEVPNLALDVHHIHFWGTTTLATDAGGWQQTNRAALPLVPLMLNPNDDEEASNYNTTEPANDQENYASLFSQRVARVVAALGTVENPEAYGQMVADLFFPDLLAYEVGTPAIYGFARRNGRTLTDNAPEVMFSIITNSALSDGLDKSYATGTLRSTFPYLAPPLDVQ